MICLFSTIQLVMLAKGYPCISRVGQKGIQEVPEEHQEQAAGLTPSPLVASIGSILPPPYKMIFYIPVTVMTPSMQVVVTTPSNLEGVMIPSTLVMATTPSTLAAAPTPSLAAKEMIPSPAPPVLLIPISSTLVMGLIPSTPRKPMALPMTSLN